MQIFKHLAFGLALAAGLMAGCNPPMDSDVHQAKLTVSPSAKKIAEDGTASFTFTFSLTKGKKVIDLKDREAVATISFTATGGGSVSPTSATTDENGQVSVTYTTSHPEGFTEGTVTGTVKKVESKDAYQQGDLATATATVLGLDAEEPVDDSVIKKAEALKDNTYEIHYKGATTTRNLTPGVNRWYVGTCYEDRSKTALQVELMEEDDKYATTTDGMCSIPLEVLKKLTVINQEFLKKYPWFFFSFHFFQTLSGEFPSNYVGCKQGSNEGNLKLDGSCQFWVKEAAKPKSAYSGDYLLLFALSFKGESYDPDTGDPIVGNDDYVIYGKVTLTEIIADLTSFSLYPSSGAWVAQGQSITLTADWTSGASFDWSKVTLQSQTRNGLSGNWFSWDASTQTLRAIADAENQKVELTFGYSGTDLTRKIGVYNGPGFKSFSLYPSFFIVAKETLKWYSNDMIDIEAESWTPTDYYYFNYHSIEIDPSSDNYSKLYFNDEGPYVQFSNTIPEGDYNLVFRSKADHSVKLTVPYKVVNHKVNSFQITYRHSNGLFEPSTNGGENGICNYPVGMEVGVKTDPEDAYWDWSHVELAPGYDENFTFSGHGGRDDHPKLFPKTSHSSPVLGTQVKFRLKWDHNKSSIIYVDHN